MITVKCSCGRDLTVDDRFAGKSARCGACGAVVTFPATRSRAPSGAASPQPAKAPVPKPAAAPAAPPAEAPAPAPEKVKKPARGDLLFLCILVLLTIVVPWQITKDKAVWSWDVLGDAPQIYLFFVIALWATALVTFLLGCGVAGLTLSVPLALMSAAGAVLMAMHFGEDTLTTLAAPLGVFAPHSAVLNLTPAFVFFLFLLSNARWRAGGGKVLGLLEAVAAAGTLALLGIIVIPRAGELISEFSNVKSFNDFVGSGLFKTAWLLLVMFVLLIAGVVGVLHGLALGSRRIGPSKAAAWFTKAAVALLVLQVMFEPAVGRKWMDILNSSVGAVVLYSIPMLLCSGVSRMIGEIASAVIKPKAPAAAAPSAAGQ